MAIYHFSVKPISRANGRSATAAAAYRAGEKIHDERTGETFDYTRKTGILVSRIVTPLGVQPPEWANDRERLWNEAERAETRINSRVAREAEIALPHELPPEAREELARSLAQLIADRYKVPVDYSIHEPARNGDDRNHHAHILFATREIDSDGFGKKTRILDAHETGPDEIDKLRADWAELVNRSFDRAGIAERIDPRTLEAQGIDRDPTQHLGPDATAMERRGEETALGDFNRAAAQTTHPPREDRASQPKPSGDLSRKERRELVTKLHSQSDGPEAFQQALAENGFTLATGDRRPFVAIDSKGAPHNLARLIPDATNDSLREYFAPIVETLHAANTIPAPERDQPEPLSPVFNRAAETGAQNKDQPRLTETFSQAAERPEPPLKDSFNRQAEPPPKDEKQAFFEAQKEQAVFRMLEDYKRLLDAQERQTEEKESIWRRKIEGARDKLEKKQEGRREREEEAHRPKGLEALWERFKDKLDPDRIETRRQEAARIDAERQEREASERLALDQKLQEVLDKNRALLEAEQERQRQDLDRQHAEYIQRTIDQEKQRQRILEDYQRAQKTRDLTREDNERERGRDR